MKFHHKHSDNKKGSVARAWVRYSRAPNVTVSKSLKCSSFSDYFYSYCSIFLKKIYSNFPPVVQLLLHLSFSLYLFPLLPRLSLSSPTVVFYKFLCEIFWFFPCIASCLFCFSLAQYILLMYVLYYSLSSTSHFTFLPSTAPSQFFPPSSYF